jgi:hypothetical protein
MIETKEFSVGRFRYKVTQFGAKKGQALLLTCAKLIGESVGEVAAANGGDVQLGKALKALFSELSETTFHRICEDFAEVCIYTSEEKEVWKRLGPDYNDHFAGRYKDLLLWLRECFNANYESFFSELQDLTGLQLQKTAPPVNPSQST